MQKSQPSFPPGRSALAGLLGRFFANPAKGSWSRSAWFLKALGHGSWNECLENRLVFSSPLWLLASWAGRFFLPELKTVATLAHVSAPFIWTDLYQERDASCMNSPFRLRTACQEHVDCACITTLSAADPIQGQLTEERGLNPKG